MAEVPTGPISKLLGNRLNKTHRDIASGRKAFSDYHLIHLANLWLVACLAYYELDDPFMSDQLFDNLTGHLLANHSRLKEAGVWWVDGMFPRDALEAGTGYHLKHLYPVIIQEAVVDIEKRP